MARRAVAVKVGRSTFRGSSAGGSEQAMSQALQSSLGNVINGFNQFVASLEQVMPEVLIDVLTPTFEKSQMYCPYKSGRLRESGYLEARSGTRTAEVEIGYGRGGDPEYAVAVHELPRWHQEPTRDKFLQAAVEEDMPDIISSLPSRIQEAAGT